MFQFNIHFFLKFLHILLSNLPYYSDNQNYSVSRFFLVE